MSETDVKNKRQKKKSDFNNNNNKQCFRSQTMSAVEEDNDKAFVKPYNKCLHCGQLSTSPIVRCKHCRHVNSDAVNEPKIAVDIDNDNDVKPPMVRELPKISEDEPKYFPLQSPLPQYVMFGTFKTSAKVVDIDNDFIKIQNVSSNNSQLKCKYHIMIPFNEIQELMYCSDPLLPLICLKPTEESNDKIQESMFLGNNSSNDFRFDINSENSSEQYIIIVFNTEFCDQLKKPMNRWIQMHSKDIKCDAIGIDKGKLLLNNSQQKSSRMGSSEQRFQQVINSSTLKTPPNQSSPYRVGVLSSMSSLVRRTFSRSPAQTSPQTETITLADDEDEEDIIVVKTDSESQFNKVIFIYPEDERNAIHVIGNDIKCLNKGEFLNDNIVNFYLRYFYKEKLEDNMRLKTHIFDTLFFTQLTEKRPQKRKNTLGNGREETYTFLERYQKKLKKWTKGLDLFAKDFLVFPIIKESHWFLILVCYPQLVHELKRSNCDNKSSLITDSILRSHSQQKRPCVIFMDSLGNASYKRQFSQPVREFLAHEWREKRESDLSFTKDKMKDLFPKVPNQTNSSDCGLYILEYIEQFLKEPDEAVLKVFDNRYGLKQWFRSEVMKNKRQSIRGLILGMVSEETKLMLETLVDDSKLSDSEDRDENDKDLEDELAMEAMDLEKSSDHSYEECLD